MFERFTERARQVIVLAQDEARSLKHSYIGTEHLLLGLLREEEGLAARALEDHITVDEVRTQVKTIVGLGDEVPVGQIPLTPRAKSVLELSLREALSLGHNYIGTEHILLGMVRENEGIATRILLHFDADAEMIRNQIIRMLSGPRRRQAPSDAEIGKVILEKEAAIEVKDFLKASTLRDKQREMEMAKAELTEETIRARVWRRRLGEWQAEVWTPAKTTDPPLSTKPQIQVGPLPIAPGWRRRDIAIAMTKNSALRKARRMAADLAHVEPPRDFRIQEIEL